MSYRSPRLLLPTLALALLLPTAARAAEPESVVNGTGTATIEKTADTMRMQVQIQVEGASLKDALAKLATRRDEVKAGLLKLGALEKKVTAEDATVADGASASDRRAALERALRDRATGRGGPATQSAPKVTALCTLKAEWTLKADTPEAAMIAAEEIKNKVKAAKLLEAKLSPAAAEEAEELAGMMDPGDGPAPNEPLYFFVATVTEAERTKATADAFAKAKQSAALLAKAAGAELGALRALDGSASVDSEDAYAMRDYYDSPLYRQMMLQSRGGGEVSEAISARPGKVSLQVAVRAAFAIK